MQRKDMPLSPKGELVIKSLSINRNIMSEESLNDFHSKIDSKYLSKNIFIIKITLIVSIIFLLADLFLWFRIYTESVFSVGISLRNYILPVTIFIVFVLSVFGWTYNLKGNQLIQKAFTENNGDLFNTGFRKIITANLLALTSILTAITSAVFELYLQN